MSAKWKKIPWLLQNISRLPTCKLYMKVSNKEVVGHSVNKFALYKKSQATVGLFI